MGRQRVRAPVTRGCARVPVVMQLEALECGAACLAMVLAYYGRWIPLEQVRGDCGVSRDGSNARNLLRAARGHGLAAQGYRCEPEDLRRRGRFPCILHWEFNHFVVLCGFRRGRAVINDPARGTCTVSMEDLDGSFTGVCLQFEPGEDFTPQGHPKSILSFARRRLTGAGGAVAFAALTAAAAALFGLIAPAFSRVLVDRLLTGEDPEWLIPFLLALALLSLLQLTAEWLRAVYALRIDGKLAAVGSTAYLWKVLRLPMEFFSQRLAGDIQQRQQANAAVAGTLVNLLAPLALNAAMMLFYLTVMLRYSPLLTAVGLGSTALNLLFSQYIARRRLNLTRVKMRDEGKLAGTTVAGIEMIETIKASGAEDGFFQKWAGYQASVNTQEIRFLQLSEYLGLLPELISAAAETLVLILGVSLTMEGQFTAGMVMAFQSFLAAFTAPASSLIEAGQALQEMRAQMERVEDVMEYPSDLPEETGEAPETCGKLSGALELRHVTFGYSRLAPPLIEDFSLTVRPGGRVALTGPSGCGKSTLAKLIAGLYQPWSGEILFDGKPIREIDRSVFTGSLAVVDQDVTLFEDTIANNIKMWDSSIEDFEMILAARDAQLHGDIMGREGGYQYRLAEGGRDLSGGQRQRLEIARVLAQDPTIVVLDEATSALDAQTEYDVVQSIQDRGVTCVVVAHRLSTIRRCDEIIVLDQGKAVERGTHEELCARNGAYTRLITSE